MRYGILKFSVDKQDRIEPAVATTLPYHIWLSYLVSVNHACFFPCESS